MPRANELERHDVATQLRDFGRVLREQWWLIALCVILSAAVAVAYAETRPRDYRATAKLLLQQDNPNSQLAGTGAPFIDPVRQAATDQQLVTSAPVATQVAKELRLGSRAPGLLSDVTAAVNGDSNLLSVTASGRNARLTARIANAFAEKYIAFRRAATRQRLRRALRELESRVRRAPKADRPALRAQIARARVVTPLGAADAQIVQRAGVPGATIGPNISRKLIVGLIFGVLLGVGLALLRDRLDPRVKRVADVKEIFPGVPLLATIPRPRAGKGGSAMTVEGFRTLQSNVDVRCPNGRPRTLLVTSAGSGDGKSTTVLNLGLAMNEARHSALVLEADLRRPALSTGLGVNKGPGLTKVLSGKGALVDSITHASVSPSSKRRGPSVALAGKLAVVPAGPSAARPRTLLAGDAMESLLASASAAGDTILVDGPPLGLFSDMIPLARRADGVIVAVRLYHSRKDELERFAEQLVDAEVRPVGMVVLGSSGDPSAYDGY
jgi:polysaccharide biosynthesis transport protein